MRDAVPYAHFGITAWQSTPPAPAQAPDRRVLGDQVAQGEPRVSPVVVAL
jgi:hypothetical protein